MGKIQKINCTVNSCAFNNKNHHICELNEIKVAPCPECNNGKAQDESMCDSYKQRN